MQTVADREQTLDEIESTFELPPETMLPVHVPKDPEALQLELFGITQARIEALREKCLTLKADTPRGYEETRNMLGLLRKTWVRVEKLRLGLNRNLQEEIRWHNSIGKTLIDLAHSIGDPLAEKLRIVDDAKELAKRAAEQAETERLAAIEREKPAAAEAVRRAEHEAAQAQLKEEADRLTAQRVEMEAERKRMDEWLAAERTKSDAAFKAERDRIEIERQADQDRLSAERAILDAERKVIDDANRREFQRQAQVKAEQEAAVKVERDRLAAIAKTAADQAERERIEAARPDVDRVHVYGAMIRALPGPPQTESHECETVLLRSLFKLALIADELEAFTLEPFKPSF